jgi:hypothetical protein
MELKEFAKELKIRMNAEIDTISTDELDVLLKTSQIISVIEKYVQELKQFLIKYKFKRIDEEIEFFKTIKPHFISALWYHKRLFKIQLFEAYHVSEARLKYHQRQLFKLQTFISRHHGFYQYILCKSDHMDDKYFIRVNTSKRCGVIDERFSTHKDILLAKILCNENLKDYVLKAIQRIETPSPAAIAPTLRWTGSKTDLVELIYALNAAGVFNKASADVKQIAQAFEQVFSITLGNYYRVFQDIRLRKTNQMKFIDAMRSALSNRIAESDF